MQLPGRKVFILLALIFFLLAILGCIWFLDLKGREFMQNYPSTETIVLSVLYTLPENVGKPFCEKNPADEELVSCIERLSPTAKAKDLCIEAQRALINAKRESLSNPPFIYGLAELGIISKEHVLSVQNAPETEIKVRLCLKEIGYLK